MIVGDFIFLLTVLKIIEKSLENPMSSRCVKSKYVAKVFIP